MNDWMNKLRDRFARFMYGRYGSDEFSRFLLYAALVLMILGVFLRTPLFRYLGIASLIGCYFRMFSKDMDARRRENSWYLGRSSRCCSLSAVRRIMRRTSRTTTSTAARTAARRSASRAAGAAS